MFEAFLIGVGFIVFLFAMIAFIRIGVRVQEYAQMTPEQERQYEIDTQPVYAYATITSENTDEVVTAQILHVQNPERYPAVPAVEARKGNL